jgi:hypothetical protein
MHLAEKKEPVIDIQSEYLSQARHWRLDSVFG